MNEYDLEYEWKICNMNEYGLEYELKLCNVNVNVGCY